MFIPTAIFVKKTEICKSADNKKTAAFSRERLPSIGASNRLPYIPTLSNQYINHISKNSFPFFGNPAFRRSGVLVVAIAPQLPDGCPFLIHIDLFFPGESLMGWTCLCLLYFFFKLHGFFVVLLLSLMKYNPLPCLFSRQFQSICYAVCIVSYWGD